MELISDLATALGDKAVHYLSICERGSGEMFWHKDLKGAGQEGTE